MDFSFKKRTVSVNMIESKKIADIVTNIVKHNGYQNKFNIKRFDEITQQIQESNTVISQANILIFEENMKLLAEQFETNIKPIIYNELKLEIKNELKINIENEFTSSFKGIKNKY